MLPKWGAPTKKPNWSVPNTQSTKTKWGFSTNQNTNQPIFLNKKNQQKSHLAKFKPIFVEKSMHQVIYLLSKANFFDFFKSMPLTYTISTKNSEAKFNLNILLDSSKTISHAYSFEPTKLQYHLDIDDDKNVLSKFQRLFQGENVEFDAKELIIARKITNELNITCCPIFLKNENYSISYVKPFLSNNNMLIANIRNDLIANVQKRDFCTFTIETKAKKYKCNIIGVLSSTVIRDFMIKNPLKQSYFYDYDDKKNEFQTICNIFNFEKVVLSNDNVFIMKEIGDDLKIDCFSSTVENYIDLKETVSRLIDDQQNTIDTIDDLFDLLYNIKEKKVENVAMKIDESEWSKTEENVIELAAFIIQVIENSYQLHPYIIDLLIKLNENQSSNLKSLLPFISNHLLKVFRKKMRDTNCNLVFPFVYQMMKKGLISKEEINKILYEYEFNTRGNLYDDIYDSVSIYNFFIVWFLPEFLEVNHKQAKINENIQTYYPYTDYNIELFKERRDKGEYDDEIAIALRNDDIDKFQAYITINEKKLIKEKIKTNMFEPLFDKNTRYLNYAAAYGSIKCFKYLLLNNEKVDYLTFYMAIVGGNNELIRLVDNSISKLDVDQKQLIKSLIHTIKRHQNNLFDWLLETKLSLINTEENLESLLMCSIENGNPHAMIQLIDNGFDFNKNPYKYIKFLEAASRKGFFLLDNLLLNLMKKPRVKELNLNIDPVSTVSFGNISIFKLFIPSMYNVDFKKALVCAVNEKYISIIHYFFDDLLKAKKIMLNSDDIIKVLGAAIQTQSNDIFKYIFDNVNNSYTIGVGNLNELLINALTSKNFEASKILSENIHKSRLRHNFTNSCFLAIKSNLKGIVELYINEKYQINLTELSEQISTFGSTDVEIFTLIYNNSDSNCQNTMKKCINKAIEKLNKPLVRFLLDKDSLLDDSLFEASKTNSLELVEMILKKNSEPSYINKVIRHSNPLIIAAEHKNLPILKRLISVPGIDPSVYGILFETPLIISCRNFSSEIFSEILGFYGENIKNEKWQLYKALDSIFGQNFPSNPKSQEVIKFILNKIIDLNLIDLNYGSNDLTILIYACENNLIDIVKKLIQIDFVNVNAYSPSTVNTPLYISIEKRNEEISTILINCPKADINIRNDDGKTPFIRAIELNQVKIVDLLINNDKFNIQGNNIDYALSISSFKIAERLLRLNIFKSIDFNIKPPLYLNNYMDIISGQNLPNKLIITAIKTNESDFLDYIIDNKYFCISNESVITYMILCIVVENSYFFKKLITKYIDCDINMLFLSTKISILTLASQKNSSDEIITSILNHPKFDSSKSNIIKAFEKSFDKYHSSILDLLWDYDSKHDHLIESYLNDDLITFLTTNLNKIDNDFMEKVDFIINHGIDLNKPNKSGDYCLEYAIHNNNEPLSLALIRSGKIDLNKKIPIKGCEPNYTSYLHLAIEYENMEAASELISEESCDIDITDSNGETPLMCACRKRDLDCIMQLFGRSCLDYQHRNNNNEDCLEIIKKSFPDLQNDIKENDNNDRKCNNKYIYLSEINELINKTFQYNAENITFKTKQISKDKYEYEINDEENKDQFDLDIQEISTKQENENEIKEEQSKNQFDLNNLEILTKEKQENENEIKEEHHKNQSSSTSSKEKSSDKINQINLNLDSNNQEKKPYAFSFIQSKSIEKAKTSFDAYNESFSEKPDPNFINLISELKQKNQNDSQNQKPNIDQNLQQTKVKPEKQNDLNEISHISDLQSPLRKRKDKRIANSLYNEDVDYNYYLLHQNQYQLQQEQQLQWFQMIQVNNALQAQMNIQMLNQYQVNQKGKKKHGKKRSKK